ncbi:hypothetical protein [Neptunitalea lumnitzerae]|uniref:hypothetical protein n=1 Tax=Neptunitalea lumnitzerae TaxID=2965509 RepID=UPI0024917D0C|nr:hypothetical protein [Neptunitalea sp. Y10]
MKKLLIFSFLLVAKSIVYGQEIEVPVNPVFESEADYKAYETKVLEAIDWAAYTPVNTETDKRKKVNAFLLEWMSGTPYIDIVVSDGLVPYMEHPECFMVFMSGWTKYSLTHNYTNNELDCALAGTEHVIIFYEKNKSALGKIGSIEKLIKLQKKGKLKNYIEKQLEG